MIAIYEQQNAFNPNARHDMGPNAAGCGRASNQPYPAVAGILTRGLQVDGHIAHSTLRIGQNVAGAPQVGLRAAVFSATVLTTNTGGNIAGSPTVTPQTEIELV